MLKRVLAHYASGLCAGTLIAIGGGVFLGCRSMGNVGQVAGAVFFTVALLCICLQGYALYTGRIGFIPEKHDTEALSALFLGLAGNLSATMLWGLAVRYAIPSTAVILAGFEHSIADFFYFSAAAEFSGQMWLFTLAALLGNSVGAMLLPLLASVGKDRRAA